MQREFGPFPNKIAQYDPMMTQPGCLLSTRLRIPVRTVCAMKSLESINRIEPSEKTLVNPFNPVPDSFFGHGFSFLLNQRLVKLKLSLFCIALCTIP